MGLLQNKYVIVVPDKIMTATLLTIFHTVARQCIQSLVSSSVKKTQKHSVRDKSVTLTYHRKFSLFLLAVRAPVATCNSEVVATTASSYAFH